MKIKRQHKLLEQCTDDRNHLLRIAYVSVGIWVFIILWCILTGTAYGQEESETVSKKRIYDMANILDIAYTDQAEGVIADYQDQYHLDIVVVTTEDAQEKTATAYADDFYDTGSFGQGSDKDGILFLIDMDNRELVFSTGGRAIRIFTDQRIESMLDNVYEGASQGDYTASVKAFLTDVERYCKAGIPNGQYNYDTETGKISVHRSIEWSEAILAFGVAAFVAGFACITVKRQYRMEQDYEQIRNLNMAYRSEAKFVYHDQNDQLVDKFIRSAVIPRDTGSHTHGGHSSSGRSSTHTSSGGHTHGGGSRGF